MADAPSSEVNDHRDAEIRDLQRYVAELQLSLAEEVKDHRNTKDLLGVARTGLRDIHADVTLAANNCRDECQRHDAGSPDFRKWESKRQAFTDVATVVANLLVKIEKQTWPRRTK